MLRSAVSAALLLTISACSSIGPATVSRDRVDYASSIGNSWKEQTLLNIVKLRYADMPVFLEVAQVIAGYQLQSTIGGTFTTGNFNAALIGPLTQPEPRRLRAPIRIGRPWFIHRSPASIS